MFNIISFGKRKENLLQAVRTGTIGSTLSTFKESVQPGATVFLHCNGMIWATAKVDSDYFFSEIQTWTDKIYPHRFKIADIKFAKSPVQLSDGVINAKFREGFGSGWAYRFIFSPKPVPPDIAQLINNSIQRAGLTNESYEKIVAAF